MSNLPISNMKATIPTTTAEIEFKNENKYHIYISKHCTIL